MSIQAMAWVLDDCEATGTDRLVLLAIANHLNGGNESEGWSLGMERIAREARVHPKTARRSVLRLEAEGIIRVQRTLGGSRMTNRYWLTCFEEPPRDGEGSDPEQGYPQPPRSVQKPPRSVQKPPRSVPEPSHGWERNRNNQNNQNNRGGCSRCGGSVNVIDLAGVTTKVCQDCKHDEAVIRGGVAS